MTVLDDTLKGTTLAEPDGPPRFVEYLDCEVPTFINPRDDLVVPHARGKTKSVDHHVPFAFRGEFTTDMWPKAYRDKVHSFIRTNMDGFVLCTGKTREGTICQNKAMNRTLFCRNHGGALHPADKKLSAKTLAPMPEDRIENLDRVQKFMQGFLSVEDLDDDEITNQFVRTSAGVPIKARALGKKFEQIITVELHARLNRYLVSKTPRALEVLYEILDSDMVEPADRLKAVQMLTDRTMGKPADVLITHTSEEKPYESILVSIESGSREDYRKKVASSRAEIGLATDGNSSILEAEEVDITDLERQSGVHSENESGAISEELGSGESPRLENDDDGRNQSSLAAADEKRKAQIEARDRIKKARAKRFARRATGGLNGEAAYLPEFRVIANEKSPDLGKYKLKLHPPEKITEAVIARATRSNAIDLVDALAAKGVVG